MSFHTNQNQEEINNKTENVNTTSKQLEEELEKRQSMIDEIKSELNMIQPNVPEDILTVLGKIELDAKVKELTKNLEALIKKRNYLLNQNTFKKKLM